jgi:two-component system response regulator (stage 0 sporulation protein A)
LDVETKKNVIVVEDDIELMDLYKDIFSNLDKDYFKVVYATSGTEAFRKFENQAFDIMVTDYKMAKGDGLALVERIDRERGMKLPYVILVSAYVTKPVLTKMKEMTGKNLKIHLKPASSQELINDVIKIAS